MKKVLVTIPEGDVKNTFFPDEVRSYAEKYFDVTYNTTENQYTKDELKELLKNYDAVMTGWGSEMLTQEVLEGNDRLKAVVHTGGTVGNLVDSYVYGTDIKVFSGNIMYAESVAEGVLAYMLTGLRRIPDYIDTVREGGWRTEAAVWEGLLDKTVGIIGLGTISSILIPMLRPFRVKIKLFSHYKADESFLKENNCETASLDEIFETCDIVSVHSALNSENRRLIKKEHFEKLRDGALFLNTARGAVIDQEALIDELGKNRFRAVLDVYDGGEPIAEDSPLRSLKNVYSIPHMAGPTLDRRDKITRALVDEMCRFFDGEKELKFEITEEIAKRMTKM